MKSIGDSRERVAIFLFNLFHSRVLLASPIPCPRGRVSNAFKKYGDMVQANRMMNILARQTQTTHR